MHGERGEVAGDAGDRRRVGALPLGGERLGVPAGDADRVITGLGVADLEDRPVVSADLVLIAGGDLGEDVAGAVKLEGNNVSFSVFGLVGVVCAACASRWRSVVNSPPGSRCCCRTSTSASSAWRWRSRRGCWGVVACARSRRWLASARRPSARACSSWRPARSRSRPVASAGQVGDASPPPSRTPTWSQPCWRWSSRTSVAIRCRRCGGQPSRCGTWPGSSPGRAIRSRPRRWADC